MKFKIDLKFFLFVIFFYFANQLNLYLITIIFCLIHELAHILIAKILKFKIQYMELLPFGFCCNICPKIEDYNKKILKSNMTELKKMFIYISGPLANIIIILIIYYKFRYLSNYNIIIFSNIIILFVNFLPIIPLDGGRFLKSLFKIMAGNIKSNIINYYISNIFIILFTIFTSIIILYFKNYMILIFLIYLWYIVSKENKIYNIKRKIYEKLDIY